MAKYSDILTPLVPNPATGDAVRTTDANAVKQSLLNLLLTDRYERRFQPRVGSNIRQLLFQPITKQTLIMAERIIKECIDEFEPRAIVDAITVTESPEQQLLIVIEFRVVGLQDRPPTTIKLKV